MAIVYKITSPSGKVYIGSTKDQKRRFKEYLTRQTPYQVKLNASFDKYGVKNHIFDVLWEGDISEMLLKEVEFGIKFNVLDRKLGLNLKLPKLGDLPISFSEDTLKKMSLARKGKEAYWNNEIVSIYDLEGNYLRTFKSLKRCSKYLRCSPMLIRRCCDGSISTIKKKYQARKGKNINNIGIPKERKIRSDLGKNKSYTSKPIICIEDNKEFKSLSEASNYYSISITTISNILHGRTKKTRNGKTFRSI